MAAFEEIAARYLDDGQIVELRRRLFIWDVADEIAQLPLVSRLEAGVVPVAMRDPPLGGARSDTRGYRSARGR